MAEENGAMFDEFVQGGLLDDADVTIKSARFVTWDYQGKIAQPVLALKVDLEDTEGTVHSDHLSCGELRFFVPSSDGKKAVPVGAQSKLNINTNAIAFLISLINADVRGEWAAKIKGTSDISVLDGGRVHIVRKAQPRRATINQAPAVEGARVPQQLVVEKVLQYPWEGAGAAAAATRPAAAAAAPAAGANNVAASSAVEDMAVGTLLTILAENGGAIKTAAIAGKVFSNAAMKAETAPVRNSVLGMIVKPEFLGAEGRPWTFDKSTGTVALAG